MGLQGAQREERGARDCFPAKSRFFGGQVKERATKKKERKLGKAFKRTEKTEGLKGTRIGFR